MTEYGLSICIALENIAQALHGIKEILAQQEVGEEKTDPERVAQALSELKPCPFCGGTEILFQRGIIGDNECCFSVICDVQRRGCGAVGVDCRTPAEAVEAWNRRMLNRRELRQLHPGEA